MAVGKEGVELQAFAGYHMLLHCRCSSFNSRVAFGFVLVTVAFSNRKGDSAPNTDAPAEKKEGTYRVSEVMNSHPLTIPANATMSEATQVLADNEASGAILVDDDLKVCGFISNSDILRFFSDDNERYQWR